MQAAVKGGIGMKVCGWMLGGAIGYAMGCKMGMMRKCMQHSLKQMKHVKRMMCRKLGL